MDEKREKVLDTLLEKLEKAYPEDLPALVDGVIKLCESSDYSADHDFERKRLEGSLLKIIERESDDAATPTGLIGVACIARILIDLWKS